MRGGSFLTPSFFVVARRAQASNLQLMGPWCGSFSSHCPEPLTRIATA